MPPVQRGALRSGCRGCADLTPLVWPECASLTRTVPIRWGQRASEPWLHCRLLGDLGQIRSPFLSAHFLYSEAINSRMRLRCLCQGQSFLGAAYFLLLMPDSAWPRARLVWERHSREFWALWKQDCKFSRANAFICLRAH